MARVIFLIFFCLNHLISPQFKAGPWPQSFHGTKSMQYSWDQDQGNRLMGITMGLPCYLTARPLAQNYIHNSPCAHLSADISHSLVYYLPLSMMHTSHSKYFRMNRREMFAWMKPEKRIDPSNMHACLCCFAATYYKRMKLITNNIHNTLNYLAFAKLW